MLSILAGFVVSLVVAAAVPAFFAGQRAAAAGSPGAEPALVGATSVAYEFSDFFNVPWGEYWDLRTALYGDLPIGAECFSAAGVAVGYCTPADPTVPDVDTAPYTNWYPGVGNPGPSNPNADPFVNAPYRLRVTGTDVQGYTLAEPVYFPVLNPAASAGTRLDFTWSANYLTLAEADALTNAGCNVGSLDGYQIRSIIDLTMDLQESRRLFGVVGANANEAQSWWDTNTNAACLIAGPAEAALNTWFNQMGGTSFTLGKYDIYNSFEWFYQIFYTQMSASVDPDGTTHVRIDHTAWGTEVLLARFFYWGATSYILNYLDSTQARGWMGFEVAWFEYLSFAGGFSAADHDFSLSTAMQYHFQQLAAPGSDGNLDRIGDVPFWQWGAWLNDYVNDFSPRHLISELDRYPGDTYVQSTPGHPKYGQALPYDYTPATWDMTAAESAIFRFPSPTTDVVFYDPNLTPLGALPLNGFVELVGPVNLMGTVPTSYGTFDALTNTLTVVGPAPTGGPAMTPGADGVPGTADDQYPLDPFPQINLGVGVAPPPAVTAAALAGRSAWPERHHWDQSNDADGMVSLFAKVANIGNTQVSFAVIFTIVDEAGVQVASITTATYSVGVGAQLTIEDMWSPSGFGRFRVTAMVTFDSDGDGSLDSFGARVKSFSFAIVP
jgi:hypothetical protein